MKKVLTIGTFDLLHVGHIDLFNTCRELAGEGGTVFVAINTDEFVEKYKGKRPIIHQEDRIVMVDACRYVDFAYFHESGEDCRDTIEKVKPDILVVGSDWLSKNYLNQIGILPHYLEENNICLVYAPRKHESSSKIKERIVNEG
jgi:glycerol-3-phosphate cytidylyltransferase